MPPESHKQQLKDIPTDVGNSIIESLKTDGWQIVEEYSRLHVDKGIDYDQYVLQCGEASVTFEWDNWFEWSIEAEAKVITTLQQRFKALQ